MIANRFNRPSGKLPINHNNKLGYFSMNENPDSNHNDQPINYDQLDSRAQAILRKIHTKEKQLEFLKDYEEELKKINNEYWWINMQATAMGITIGIFVCLILALIALKIILSITK